MDASARIDGIRDHYRAMRAEISRVIVGQDDVIEQMLIAVLARGHALLEGVPGIGKTLAAKVRASALPRDVGSGKQRS